MIYSRWTGSESNLLQKQETVLLCFTDGCSYLHLSSKHCQSLIHQALKSGQLCDLKCPNRQQQTLSAVFDTTAPSAAKKVSSGRKLEAKCRFTSVIHGAFHFFQWLHAQFFSLNSPFRLLLEINKQTPVCMKKLPKGTILTTKILHELLVCVHYY